VKLRYTLLALADLNSLLDHRGPSLQGARRVQTRVQAIIDHLLLYPGIGIRTDDPAIRRMTAARRSSSTQDGRLPASEIALGGDGAIRGYVMPG
jgi:hypothetical protein